MSIPGDMEMLRDENIRPSRRRTRPTRERNSRKKACERCSLAKVRCDLRTPNCSRCETRRFNCDYGASLEPSAFTLSQVSEGSNKPKHQRTEAPLWISSESTPGSHDSGFVTSSSAFRVDRNDSLPAHNTPDHRQHTDARIPRDSSLASPGFGISVIEKAAINLYWRGEAINFASLELICPIDAIKIRNRWLADFIPSLNQRVKNYPPSTIFFISRVFKTYPTILLREGNLPPFIHPAQLSGPEIPTPLANCLSLVRMWDGQARGSECMVRAVIKNEMGKLYEERHLYDPMSQLGAFQAYLIYSMVLFFDYGTSGQLIDRQVMINLQDFASDIASSGLVCPGEISHTSPDWESWIVASSKRRTLYTLYMFDSIFCSQNGLPTFLGEELEGLLAPESKALWAASDRDVWQTEYRSHLHDWANGGLRIDELWPLPETGAEDRRKRVEKWVASVDEFGMMLFAVTLATHGG